MSFPLVTSLEAYIAELEAKISNVIITKKLNNNRKYKLQKTLLDSNSRGNQDQT